jgi:MFS family permease
MPRERAVLKLPPAYWFLWAGTLINRLGSFVLAFLALYLTEQRGFSPAGAGGVVALAGTGMLFAAPTGGALADRIGRRPTLLLSMLLGALAMLSLGWARRPAAIGAAAFLTGLLGEFYRPAAQAVIADLLPPADHTRAYGILYWAINLGTSAAAVLAGLLGGRNFQLLFVGDAATTLLCGAILWLGLPETRPLEAAGAPAGPRLRGLWRPLGDARFLRFLGAQLVLGVVFFQFGAALPLDLRAHGISTAQYGRLIALNGLVIVIFQPLGIRLTERAAPAPTLAAAAVLIGAGYGATALARTPSGYALTIVLWTLGEIAWAGVGPTVVAALSPVAARGAYQGAYMMTWALAFLLAPALGGAVLDAWGGRALWLGCLSLGLASALLHLLLVPRSAPSD